MILETGDAEIEQLRFALGGDANIGRLQIAMNDQVLMSVSDGGTEFAKKREPLADRQAVVLAIFLQPFARDIFHHEIGRADGGNARAVKPRDMRMIETRQNPRFLPELPDQMPSAKTLLDEFDRHHPAKFRILREVNLTHPALTQQRNDLVTVDAFARLQRTGFIRRE